MKHALVTFARFVTCLVAVGFLLLLAAIGHRPSTSEWVLMLFALIFIATMATVAWSREDRV